MNATQLQTLATELKTDPKHYGYAALGQDYPALAARLNAPSTNTKQPPAAAVPKPVTIQELLAAVTPAEAAALIRIPGLIELVTAACRDNDHSALQTIAAILQPDLSTPSQTAITALLTATVPDPAWTNQTGPSRAAALGLPPVLTTDLQMII